MNSGGPAFMPMYEKPVRVLMPDMLEELGVQKDQIISKDQVLRWFADKYPKIKQGTISAHLIRFSTNAPSRLHYNARPGDEDLLFQVDGSHFRRFDPAKDPPPIHEASQAPRSYKPTDEEEAEPRGSNEFA